MREVNEVVHSQVVVCFFTVDMILNMNTNARTLILVQGAEGQRSSAPPVQLVAQPQMVRLLDC